MDYASDPKMRGLYFESGQESGYHRASCVLAQAIGVHDAMAATVRDRGGALLDYSLVAHSFCEGWREAMNGTGSLLEVKEHHSGPRARKVTQHVQLFSRRGAKVSCEIARVPGSRSGARLLERLFGDWESLDPPGYVAWGAGPSHVASRRHRQVHSERVARPHRRAAAVRGGCSPPELGPVEQ